MVEHIFGLILAFMIGMLSGMVLVGGFYKERIRGIGIDHIEKYTLEGPNLSSNWYEIVWLPGKAPKK